MTLRAVVIALLAFCMTAPLAAEAALSMPVFAAGAVAVVVAYVLFLHGSMHASRWAEGLLALGLFLAPMELSVFVVLPFALGRGVGSLARMASALVVAILVRPTLTAAVIDLDRWRVEGFFHAVALSPRALIGTFVPMWLTPTVTPGDVNSLWPLVIVGVGVFIGCMWRHSAARFFAIGLLSPLLSVWNGAAPRLALALPLCIGMAGLAAFGSVDVWMTRKNATRTLPVLLIVGASIVGFVLLPARVQMFSSPSLASKALSDFCPGTRESVVLAKIELSEGHIREFVASVRAAATSRMLSPREWKNAVQDLDAHGYEADAVQICRARDAGRSAPTERLALCVLEQHRASKASSPLIDVGESLALRFPSLGVGVAQDARATGPSARGRSVLDKLAWADNATLATQQVYADVLVAGNDREGLTRLGERVRRQYPNEALGYVIQGKAARVVRDDATMIAAYERALAIDPTLADLHYELGLVYHGIRGMEARAFAHYTELLRLAPNFPRREVVETWIAGLRPVAREQEKRGG